MSQALVWVGMLATLAMTSGCGSSSSSGERAGRGAADAAAAGKAPAQSGTSAAAAAAVAPDGSAGDSVGAAAAGALPTCTDGGELLGARIYEGEVRFCLGGQPVGSCWRVAGSPLAVTAVADLAAASPGASGAAAGADVDPTLDDFVDVSLDDPMFATHSAAASALAERARLKAVAKSAPWTATIDDDGLEVCGPSGCRPFAVSPKVDDDDERTYLYRVRLSDSGARLLVTRGDPMLERMSVQLYDRASGAKLATPRARSLCVLGEEFLGEHALITEWSCVDQGGARVVVTAAGKQVRIVGEFMPRSPAVQLEGERWMFASGEVLSLYDLASGKRLLELPNRETRFAVARDQLVLFDGARAEVSRYSKTGASLGIGRAPTCRYEWEVEALGPLRLEQEATAASRALGGRPLAKKPDPQQAYTATWRFARGVALRVEASPDPNADRPVLPYRVSRIEVTSPSALRTRAGIGIGSSAAEVEAAYGAHVVASLSTEQRRFVGTPGHADGGLVFELAQGVVRKISLGIVEQ